MGRLINRGARIARPALGQVMAVRAGNLRPRGVSTHYHVECFDRAGKLAWVEDIHNLVTTEGVNRLLDTTFKTIPGSVAWFVGLIKGGAGSTFNIADTLASHAGWTETALGTDHTQNRVTWTPGTISGGSVNNSVAPAVFDMLTSITLRGLFMANVATGTAGILYGGADFATAQAVQNGYTVNVTATLTITAG